MLKIIFNNICKYSFLSNILAIWEHCKSTQIIQELVCIFVKYKISVVRLNSENV